MKLLILTFQIQKNLPKLSYVLACMNVDFLVFILHLTHCISQPPKAKETMYTYLLKVQ